MMGFLYESMKRHPQGWSLSLRESTLQLLLPKRPTSAPGPDLEGGQEGGAQLGRLL